MKEVGRMIFYDIVTGQELVTVPSQRAVSVYETPAEVIPLYPILRERDPETYDVIELEYGQCDRDFEQSTSFQVNPETRELEFLYLDPRAPEETPVYRKPLTQEVDELNTAIGTLLMESANDKATIASLRKLWGLFSWKWLH